MRKLRKKTAALLKDRKGNMMPLVVAVTICMLIIILGVAEYMRLVITAAGIKDVMESAVISTVNDNYNEVYHSVREGYAAGYEPDGESFSPSVDYGDIYSRMCFLLGLEEDGAGYVRINNGGEMEYCLSNLCVYIHNNALGAGGGPYYADASIRLEVPVRFAGKIITNMSINLKVGQPIQRNFSKMLQISCNLLHFDRLLQSCVVGWGLTKRNLKTTYRRDCYER